MAREGNVVISSEINPFAEQAFEVMVSRRIGLKTAYTVRNRARANLGTHNKTGALSKSLKVRAGAHASHLWFYEIYSDLDYAMTVESGSQPHMIFGNPLLAFTAKSGDFVIAAWVHHPGNQHPVHFLKKAIESITAADWLAAGSGL